MHRESIAEAEVASADDVLSLAHARAEMVIQQQLSQKGAKNVEAVEMKNTEAAEKAAALLPKITAAAAFDELEKLLKEPAVIATTSRRADAVQRCMGYCKLARLKELSKDDGEVMLQGWAVSSFNEWNVKQERVLVLSTKYLYRVEFKDDPDSPVGGTPVKFAAVDLGVLTRSTRASTTTRASSRCPPPSAMATRTCSTGSRSSGSRSRSTSASTTCATTSTRPRRRSCRWSSPRSSPPTASWAATASCR